MIGAPANHSGPASLVQRVNYLVQGARAKRRSWVTRRVTNGVQRPPQSSCEDISRRFDVVAGAATPPPQRTLNVAGPSGIIPDTPISASYSNPSLTGEMDMIEKPKVEFVTLKQLCVELKIDSHEAREKLRLASREPKKYPELAKAHKPRQPWEWVRDSAALKEAKSALIS